MNAAQNRILHQRKAQLRDRFAPLRDKHSRYEYLVALGKAHQAKTGFKSIRSDSQLVPGCLARLWLHCELSAAGTCCFQTDGDSVIMTGISAVLCELYDDLPAKTIIEQADILILEKLHIPQVLSSNRRNNLTKIHEYIIKFANSQFKY